ncbi:MAG: C39 family peptidase [Candidatus Acidiferrales bacterium]
MSRRGCSRLAACLAAVLAVCAASAPHAEAMPGRAEDSAGGLWLDVPFIQQKKEGCGAAALAMVMRYWSEKDGRTPPASADADTIYRALHSREAKGIVAAQLARYAEQAGYRAIAFGGEWQDLRQHLAKGRPLIAALQPGRGDPLHYLVVVGIEGGDGAVLVNDPAGRKLERMARARFEQQWRGTKNWTLLALPPATP